MKKMIETARRLAERSGGIYEVFASIEDVMAYIKDAPTDVEIWRKRVEACNELLKDFNPCIFDNDNAAVIYDITEDAFVGRIGY